MSMFQSSIDSVPYAEILSLHLLYFEKSHEKSDLLRESDLVVHLLVLCNPSY